jgi:hypothetical protein
MQVLTRSERRVANLCPERTARHRRAGKTPALYLDGKGLGLTSACKHEIDSFVVDEAGGHIQLHAAGEDASRGDEVLDRLAESGNDGCPD